MKKQKITISQAAYAFDRYCLTVENLQNSFNHFIKLNPLFKQEDLYIEIDYSHGYYDDIDIDVTIHATRDETDAEYEKRLADEAEKKRRDAENAKKSKAEAKVRQEAKDLVEYERLKKKFERN